MTIWTLVILCLGIGGASGRVWGAIRIAIGVLGTWIAYLATPPLANIVRPYAVGFFDTPALILILPPLIIFFTLVIVFYSISQAVHTKAYLYYKYKTIDEKRVLWERMNTNVGLALGVVNGALWAIILMTFIYSVGYPIMLSQPKDTAPFLYRITALMRNDLKSSGFEKLAASFDRTPESYYQSADLLGLMYQNPALQGRLMHYPLFLSLSATPQFVKFLAGPETRQILDSKAPLTAWFNTNSVTLLKNPFIKSQIAQLDTADLLEFAKTGKSAKYDGDATIGIWEINLAPTVNAVKQNHAQITPKELVQLKSLMINNAADIVAVITPDGQFFMRGTRLDFGQVKGLLQAKIVARTAPGGPPPAPAPPPANGPAAAPAMTDITQGPLIAGGRLAKDGDKIKLSIKEGDKELVGELIVLNGDNIRVNVPDGSIIFSRYR